MTLSKKPPCRAKNTQKHLKNISKTSQKIPVLTSMYYLDIIVRERRKNILGPVGRTVRLVSRPPPLAFSRHSGTQNLTFSLSDQARLLPKTRCVCMCVYIVFKRCFDVLDIFFWYAILFFGPLCNIFCSKDPNF